MKKLLQLTSMLCISLYAWVQDEPLKPALGASYPYDKGKWRTPLMQNLRLGFYSNQENDQKVSDESNVDFDFETQYFFQKNWAAGLALHWGSGKINYVSDNVNKESNWSAMGTLFYGSSLKANKIFWNAQLGIGIGSEKQTDKTASNTTEDKIDFWNFQIIAGLDILSCRTNQVYINPFVGWEHSVKNYGDAEEDRGNFLVGVKLRSSLFWDDYHCDGNSDCPVSKNMYDRGRSFIGYTTNGLFNFGNFDYTSNNGSGIEGKTNEGHLRIDYNYFFIKNISLGLTASYQYQANKLDDIDFEHNSHSFMIGPKITAHVPVNNCWRNLFGEVGAGFGSSKDETKSGLQNYTYENSRSSYWGGVGYDFVFSPSLSFTPIAEYVSCTDKEKDNDHESKTSGLNVRMGFRYMF